MYGTKGGRDSGDASAMCANAANERSWRAMMKMVLQEMSVERMSEREWGI
jgi:hypothetical protein